MSIVSCTRVNRDKCFDQADSKPFGWGSHICEKVDLFRHHNVSIEASKVLHCWGGGACFPGKSLQSWAGGGTLHAF